MIEGHTNLTEKVLKAIFGLACKAAITDNSPARNLPHHALRWRDDEDWHFHNVMLSEIDPYNSEHWRHRARGRRRWHWAMLMHLSGVL